MSVTSGFFNSVNGDRTYWAPEFANLISSIINDGILMKHGDAYAPSTNNGLSIIIGEGLAWFNNVWIKNDTALPVNIDTPHVLYSRWDAIVLNINSTVSIREGTIQYIKGDASANPLKPTLVNTTDWVQIPLVYIKVDANTTSISANDLDVRIGQTDCPYVSSVVQTTDISSLYLGWEEDFNAWFATVEAILDGNAAINLQNQINVLTEQNADMAAKIELLEGEILNINQNLSKNYQTKALVGINAPASSVGENGDIFFLLED